MTPEEKELERHAHMLEKSYDFWTAKITDALDNIEASQDFETPEELHDQIELEENLGYLIRHSEFEKKEMDKLEVRIKKYIDEKKE